MLNEPTYGFASGVGMTLEKFAPFTVLGFVPSADSSIGIPLDSIEFSNVKRLVVDSTIIFFENVC